MDSDYLEMHSPLKDLQSHKNYDRKNTMALVGSLPTSVLYLVLRKWKDSSKESMAWRKNIYDSHIFYVYLGKVR